MNKEKADRFFIPIAEEYIKSGMLDDAIAVLTEGLQAYPNYLGARVSLGKAYLEKGMTNEALKEFEYVVQLSPDNLFAHRKLVSLYKDLGRIDDAIKACETLLVFSPKDKEITELLSNLMAEKMEGAPQTEEPSKNGQPVPVVPQENIKIDFTSSWEVEQKTEKEQERVEEQLLTETMGDLYVAQGNVEKGIVIYGRILEREPDNESVREKLRGSSQQLAGRGRDSQINRLQGLLEKIQKNKR